MQTEEASSLLHTELEKFAGKEFPTTEELFKDRYVKIVDELASRVTFQQFQLDHRRYSQFFGRMSHTNYCRNSSCIDANHKKFEMTKGIRLQPVIYFLVVNFVELLKLCKKDKIFNETDDIKGNSQELMKMVFQFIFPWDNRNHKKIKQEWENISTDNSRYNVWLTLLNFPEPSPAENWTPEEIKLRGILIQFVHTLDIYNANIVVHEKNLKRENDKYETPYKR